MMQKEKLLKRSFLIATAAVSLTLAPTVVKADEEPTGRFSDAGLGSVKVNGKTAELTITANGAQEILVGTGKANVKKGTITVSTWDVYDGTSAKVDLSKLKNTADNYLVLGTNTKDNVSIVKIPVAAKYTKVKFDAGKSGLQVGYGATSADAALKELTADIGTNLEYRTVYSNWKNMEDASTETKLPDFSFYQENGAQLYVRLKGEDEVELTDSKLDEKEKLSYNNNQTAIPVYVASHLPGKEVKVSIAAKAKGPSVTADYANGTVKIPKSTEWRLVTNNSILSGSSASGGNSTTGFTSLTDGKAHSVTEVFKEAGGENLASAGLEVRKAATEKKAASKWNRLTIEKLADLKENTDYKSAVAKSITESKKSETGAPPAATDKLQEYKGSGIGNNTGNGDGAAVYEDGKTESVFKIEYDTTGTKTKTNIIKITNSGKYNYELRVGAKGATEAPTEGKATKIGAATASRAKTVTLKSVADFSTIWIRKAGDKKTTTWATNWAKLGDVDYPYEVAAKETSTTGGNTTQTP